MSEHSATSPIIVQKYAICKTKYEFGKRAITSLSYFCVCLLGARLYALISTHVSQLNLKIGLQMSYLHLAKAGLIVMAPGEASGRLLPLQGLLHLLRCEKHLNVDQVLKIE